MTNKFLALESKKYIKYLGVLIDNGLSWKYHINFIFSKISKTIGIISRIRHFVPRHIVIKIYQSLIYPYVSYIICVWSQSAKTNLKMLLVLPKRAIRLMHFTSNHERAAPYFVQSRILPLDSLVFQQIAYLMHDVDNHIAPKNIVILFKKAVRSVHSNRTRSVSSDEFYLDYSRLNIQQNSYFRLGARKRNSIPPTIRPSFKKNIINLFFKVLIEHYYFSLAYAAQTNPGSTQVTFCRVNTANPGSTRVKSNPLPEVGSTQVKPGLVWKSVL